MLIYIKCQLCLQEYLKFSKGQDEPSFLVSYNFYSFIAYTTKSSNLFALLFKIVLVYMTQFIFFFFLFHRFSSGQELANLFLSSDLLHHSWITISALSSHPYINKPILFKVYPYHSNGAIVAFVSSPTCNLQKEMVSSEELQGSQSPFDFISTKLNPHFSVNKAAITLFASLLNDLSALKEQVLLYSSISLQKFLFLLCQIQFVFNLVRN